MLINKHVEYILCVSVGSVYHPMKGNYCVLFKIMALGSSCKKMLPLLLKYDIDLYKKHVFYSFEICIMVT